MANVDSLADLIKQQAFLQAGGKAPGTSSADQFGQGYNLVNTVGQGLQDAIKQRLEIKKAELQGPLIQAQTQEVLSKANPPKFPVNTPLTQGQQAQQKSAFYQNAPIDWNGPDINSSQAPTESPLAPQPQGNTLLQSASQTLPTSRTQMLTAEESKNYQEANAKEQATQLAKDNVYYDPNSGLQSETPQPGYIFGKRAEANATAVKYGLEKSKPEKPDTAENKAENEAINRVASIRGDKSLARTEEQRDAAATAYNRIAEIQNAGQKLNPIDYIDVLGQIYKARTGTAPTNEVLGTAKQETAQGQFNKWYTYFTGKQAPATSENIGESLKNMAYSMGNQSDKFHAGYMASHLIKPSVLSDARWEVIKNTGRGLSFADATKDAQQTTSQPQMIRVVNPQGQTGMIPKDKLNDAFKNGYKPVGPNG